ncbi:MAG: hypothetical protein IPN51_13565 [Chloracidobacterium sp.]|nr:hypothetical protein [Chloracidobacterium sp.]
MPGRFRPVTFGGAPGAVKSTLSSIAPKNPAGSGEPLYQDVMITLMEAVSAGVRPEMPVIIGGRYGLI